MTTGTSATANVVLTNTGGSSLTLSAVTLPAAPFSADAPVLTAGTVIPAGGSVTQVVRFSPTAVGVGVGQPRRDAQHRPGRDQRAPVRDRRRHGAGVPRRRPRERRLRSVTTGTSATANVVLTNTGGSSLTLSAVTLPAAPFSADAPVLTAGTWSSRPAAP